LVKGDVLGDSSEDPVVSCLVKEISRYSEFKSAVEKLTEGILKEKINAYIGMLTAFFGIISGLVIFIYMDETERQNRTIYDLKEEVRNSSKADVLRNATLDTISSQQKVLQEVLLKFINKDD